MPDNLAMFNASDQLVYLDWCHHARVKVLYPMSALGFSGATGKDNYRSDWDSPAWRAAVLANVSLVQHHPALLGWYICDDVNGPQIHVDSDFEQSD